MLRGLWSFLLVILASSLMTAAVVHARETPGAGTIECNGAVHGDGDADQSQGDDDKAVPHHHGTCHAQSADVRDAGAIAPVVLSSGVSPALTQDGARASRPVDPALRPPNA